MYNTAIILILCAHVTTINRISFHMYTISITHCILEQAQTLNMTLQQISRTTWNPSTLQQYHYSLHFISKRAICVRITLQLSKNTKKFD